MNVHIVVDYSYLYYKYKFQVEYGKMKRLTAVVDWLGAKTERDISAIYYSMREMESFRKNMEKDGNDVTMSICFDMKSKRKEGDSEESAKYKSNRTNKLGEDDFLNIQAVESMMSLAGYNTYRYDGFEADDLINHLVGGTKNDFDYTIIYTPDTDLTVNICENVGVMRFKATKGYTHLDPENYEEYLSAEFGCRVPYNSILLFKSTVGDKSDCVAGIKRFGPKAFDKLVDTLSSLGARWEICGVVETTKQLINHPNNGLTDIQREEALTSLEMVKLQPLDENMTLPYPNKRTSQELREKAYSPYGLTSLIL